MCRSPPLTSAGRVRKFWRASARSTRSLTATKALSIPSLNCASFKARVSLTHLAWIRTSPSKATLMATIKAVIVRFSMEG